MERGAAGLARAIGAGELSAREAVEDVLARIDEVDSRTGAVARRRYDEARDEADEADRARARGDRLGPLHGVPVTVKECLEVTGLPATFGIEGRRRASVATADDPYVARLRAAGAIVVATTNVAQLLAFAETDNPIYGRTSNPWDPDRSSGGSSGGEGALCGAGASPLGLGTDIGGSVRIPAAWCGAVGFKPSAGRTPDVGRYSFPLDGPISSQVGVLGPSVADVALGLEVIAGLQTSPDASGERRSSPLTVGVAVDDGVFAVSPGVRRGVEEAAAALQADGCEIVEWSVPGAEALRLLYATLGYGLAERFTGLLGGGPVDRRVKQLIQLSRLPNGVKRGAGRLLDALGQHTLADGARLFTAPRHADGFAELVAEVERFRAEVSAGLSRQGIDVVLSPTAALAAIRHGASYDLGLMGSYTAVFNTLGWPAGTVPFTTVRPGEETSRHPRRDRALRVAVASETGSAGLPVGVQIAAPHGADALVLDTMGRLEAALPRLELSAAG